ncbi:MAG: MATE family efflux transporter [Halomonas sp.]|jgi:MATE family multidrug resistance protein|uniref:Multidrug-efflux transporter n=1 Tax=Billgrantia tianxiuensis TaxID=2497861 RepID=A0A6I6SHI4_9GAMM|nr:MULTISPECIES: MATE family efflux transporter [Halomonas]MCE8031733.1 MATE family efflux transporter [Halomonas sp. MCCC 1A11057]MDX5433583.1 MATE family efflux transporter [Halomonas sp.]QHC50148.1 MATE family efflux transporter [Halomonas tianxiuensis]
MLPDSIRRRRILRLALPIIAAMVTQSLINLIDAALVGSLGEVPLAGVGIGGYAMFLITALVFGLSSGVQAQTAWRHGEQAWHQRALPLNAGLAIALLVSLPVTLLCLWQAPWLLGWLNPSAEVTDVAVEYFRWRVLSLAAVAMIFCFRGYWNGIQQSGFYLRIMLVMHVVNVLASICLIFGYLGLPAMGAAGAGAGTSLSLLAGLGLWAWISTRHAVACGFMTRLPERPTLLTTLRLATPHSFQQLWFAAGYAVLFWILGQIDTASVAVGHVLVNLSLLLILPGVGLGMAAMSLVGQSLGEQAHGEAHRWGWDVVRLAWLCLASLALPMMLWPEHVLGLFLHDPELIALARLPLQLTAVMIVLDAAALVLGQALLGAGANRTVMTTTLSLQWLVFLPLAWWVGVAMEQGLLGIWWVQLGYRCLNSLWFAAIWQRRQWLRVQF